MDATQTQTEKAEWLKSFFEGEISVLQSRAAHYRCGNSDMADKYEREIRQVQRLIKVLDILIIK